MEIKHNDEFLGALERSGIYRCTKAGSTEIDPDGLMQEEAAEESAA
jgi:hypothetical protein